MAEPPRLHYGLDGIARPERSRPAPPGQASSRLIPPGAARPQPAPPALGGLRGAPPAAPRPPALARPRLPLGVRLLLWLVWTALLVLLAAHLQLPAPPR